MQVAWTTSPGKKWFIHTFRDVKFASGPALDVKIYKLPEFRLHRTKNVSWSHEDNITFIDINDNGDFVVEYVALGTHLVCFTNKSSSWYIYANTHVARFNANGELIVATTADHSSTNVPPGARLHIVADPDARHRAALGDPAAWAGTGVEVVSSPLPLHPDQIVGDELVLTEEFDSRTQNLFRALGLPGVSPLRQHRLRLSNSASPP